MAWFVCVSSKSRELLTQLFRCRRGALHWRSGISVCDVTDRCKNEKKKRVQTRTEKLGWTGVAAIKTGCFFVSCRVQLSVNCPRQEFGPKRFSASNLQIETTHLNPSKAHPDADRINCPPRKYRESNSTPISFFLCFVFLSLRLDRS